MKKPTDRDLAPFLREVTGRMPSMPHPIGAVRIRKVKYKNKDRFEVTFRDPGRNKWCPHNWRHAVAMAKWADKQLEVAAGKTAYTFDDAADAWIKSCERRVRAKQPTLGEAAFINYKIWAEFARQEFGSMLLHEIKTRQIRDWLERQAQRFAKRTVTGHQFAVNKILSFAVREEMLAVNPLSVDRIDMRHLSSDPVKVPERSDMTRLREYLDGPKPFGHSPLKWSYMRVAIALAASCGLRQGEVCGLCWDAIDPDTGELHIRRVIETKTHKVKERPKTDAGYRKVPTNHSVREILNDHAAIYAERFGKVEGYVVRGTGRRKFLIPNNLAGSFKFLMRDAEIVDESGKPKFSYHGLRHWFGAHATKHNQDLHEVKTWIGHKHASTTLDVYGFYIDDQEGRAKFEAMPDWLSPPIPANSIEAPASQRALPAPAAIEEPEQIEEIATTTTEEPCPMNVPDIAEPWVEPYIRARAQGKTHIQACRVVQKRNGTLAAELQRLKLPDSRDIGLRLRRERVAKLIKAEYQDSDIARMVGYRVKGPVTKVRRELALHNPSKDKCLKDKAKSPRPARLDARPEHKKQLKLL